MEPIWFHLKTSDSSGVFFVFFDSARVVIKYGLIEELIHSEKIRQLLLIKNGIFLNLFDDYLSP